MIELCIPSSLDPTLAPPGSHVISLFTQYTPYTLAGGKVWDEQERNAYADKGKEGWAALPFSRVTAGHAARTDLPPGCPIQA